MVLNSSWQLIGETYYGSISGYDKLYLQLFAKLDSQSIPNNTSTYSLYFRINNTSSYAYSGNCYASIDGTSVKSNVSLAFPSNAHVDLGTVTRTVTHDNNGTKTGISKGAAFSSYGMSEKSVSGSFDLPTIPRYANVSISQRGRTLTTISVNWSSDAARDWTRYSLDGAAWVDAKDTVASDNKSGYFTLSGFSPNTSHTVKVQVKRMDSQLWSDSGTITITTYDYARITSAPDITIGNDATVTFTNPGGAVTDVCIENTSRVALATYRRATGTSYTFKFTASEINILYANCPNSTSLKVRYYVRTNEGDLYWYDRADKTFYVNTTTNKPTFSNFTYSDANSVTTGLTGDSSKIIPGYSNLKVAIPVANKATAKNNATIKSYQAIVGESNNTITYSSSAEVSTTFSKATSNIMKVTAVDSRGLVSDSITKTATAVTYVKPTISRNSDFKRVGGVGTSVNINLSATFWNYSFGSVTNEIQSIQYKKKVKTASWDSVSWVTLETGKYQISGNNITNTTNAILTDFAVGTEYDIRILVTDKLDSAQADFRVTSGEPIVCFDRTNKSVGIDKIPDVGYALDAKGNAKIDGDFKINYNNIKTQRAKTVQGRQTKLDLSSLDTTKFYPCTATLNEDFGGGGGFRRIAVYNSLNTNKPSWATHSLGFTVGLEAFVKPHGWGATNGTGYVTDYSFSFCDQNPVGISQMTNSSTIVLWCRGGGIYNVYSDDCVQWAIRTKTYTINNESVEPMTTNIGISNIVNNRPTTIYSRFFGLIGQNGGTVNENTDFNNFLTEGEYDVVGNASVSNAPYTGTIYGKLIVKVNDGTTHNNRTNWIWQYLMDTSGRIYRRKKTNSSSWSTWNKMADAW